MKCEINVKRGLELSPGAWKLLIHSLPRSDKRGYVRGVAEGYPDSTYYRLMQELVDAGVATKMETGYRIDSKQARRL